jgi:hypothetical protein
MAPHPFRFPAEAPFGPLTVDVRPGRVARVEAAGPGFPLEVRGIRFALAAKVARGRRGWELRALDLSPADPAAAPRTVEVALALMPALAPALEARMRLFVERDIVEVHAERRVEGEGIRKVRAEIERRRAKVRAMSRAAKSAEAARACREAALRAELSGLAPGSRALPDASAEPAAA